jgi:hypothetical protein
MSYTYKTLALVWLIIFGLVALSASGLVAGSWVLLLVVAALGAPLILSLAVTPVTFAGMAHVLPGTSHEEATHGKA